MRSIRAQRHGLRLVTIACLVVATGVWSWTIIELYGPGHSMASRLGQDFDGSLEGHILLSNNESTIKQPALRRSADGLEPQRPLFDPPPKPPPPPPPVPKPNLRLVGTIVGRGAPQAILATPDGRMIFGRIDDVVEGAQIKAITLDSVELVVQDQPHVLRVAAE